MQRIQIADSILKKLIANKKELTIEYAASNSAIPCFFIDDVLPEELIEKANAVFPASDELHLKKSLKQNK